jgi:hypothetical protein
MNASRAAGTWSVALIIAVRQRADSTYHGVRSGELTGLGISSS